MSYTKNNVEGNVRFQRLILILVLICSIFNSVSSQNHKGFTSIQYITSNEGLSQSEVTAIIQDRKGFIWIGTRGGLNRYDGTKIKVYQNEVGNTNSLINNSIETLYEDSKGTIWIGTKSNGISRYYPEYERFENIRSFVSDVEIDPNLRVVSVAEDVNNMIWLGTWQKGLYIYNPNNGVVKQILDSYIVNDIYRDTNDNMWVATSFGIYKFDIYGNELNHYRDVGNSTSIWEDHQNKKFYFGRWGLGLKSLDVKTKKLKNHPIPNSLIDGQGPFNNVYSLFGDSNGILWVGTWGGGLNRFDLKTETFSSIELTSQNEIGGKELYLDVLSIFKINQGFYGLEQTEGESQKRM